MNFITYATMITMIIIAGAGVALMAPPQEEEKKESIFDEDEYYNNDIYYSSNTTKEPPTEVAKQKVVATPEPEPEPVKLTKVREFRTKQEAKSFAEGIEFVDENWKVSDIKYDYKKDKFIVEITY